MRSITKIRKQVVAAEQHFGQFIEQHAEYSGHLILLMTTVEERIQAQNDVVERQRAEITSLNEENEQLCGIISTLLQTIKASNLELVSEMMRELGLKVACFVERHPDEGKAPAVEAISEVSDAVIETNDSNVAAGTTDESAEAGLCVETDSPSSPDPAKGSLNDIMERVNKLVTEIKVEHSPDGDEQAAKNEAKDEAVAAEYAALDVEVAPVQDRIAAAS